MSNKEFDSLIERRSAFRIIGDLDNPEEPLTSAEYEARRRQMQTAREVLERERLQQQGGQLNVTALSPYQLERMQNDLDRMGSIDTAMTALNDKLVRSLFHPGQTQISVTVEVFLQLEDWQLREIEQRFEKAGWSNVSVRIINTSVSNENIVLRMTK